MIRLAVIETLKQIKMVPGLQSFPGDFIDKICIVKTRFIGNQSKQ